MGGLKWPGPIGAFADRLKQIFLDELTYTPINDLKTQSTFRLSLPKLFAGSLTSVPLSTSTDDGTPPNQAPSSSNQQSIKLVHPQLSLNLSTGRLTGSTVLSIPSGYPEILKGPTELDVTVSSDFSYSGISGSAKWGPISSEFRLQLHYDTKRLASLAGSALTGQKSPGQVLSGTKNELLHPGFDFSAVVHAAIPLIGKFPQRGFDR